MPSSTWCDADAGASTTVCGMTCVGSIIGCAWLGRRPLLICLQPLPSTTLHLPPLQPPLRVRLKPWLTPPLSSLSRPRLTRRWGHLLISVMHVPTRASPRPLPQTDRVRAYRADHLPAPAVVAPNAPLVMMLVASRKLTVRLSFHMVDFWLNILGSDSSHPHPPWNSSVSQWCGLGVR